MKPGSPMINCRTAVGDIQSASTMFKSPPNGSARHSHTNLRCHVSGRMNGAAAAITAR